MRGDHLKVWRNAYWHHGIDVGNDEVVHLAEGDSSSRLMRFLKKKTGKIEKSSMEEFLKGGHAVQGGLRNTADPLDKEETAKRAEEAVGNPSKYNVLFNNCEHFANWCETGVAVSHQIKSIAKKAGYALGGIVAGAVAHKFGVKVPFPKVWEGKMNFKRYLDEI